jgi:cell division protein FtsI (penicillin-binding protein 3)/stage V sporulation protein D (sporulation-specific penicillin-binding protein)
VTTIEPSVELFLENELQAIRDKWGSDGAGGVIIDPTTGEIVALAWNPSFDPNDFKESNVSVFNNPIVEGVYEMGSIIKPITMASGLDSGTVSASSTYDDLGFLVLDKKRISNYDGRGRGIVDMQEVLNQSLNTGAAYVAMKMGNKKFSDYMKSFGVGTETGIDLPNEARGLINNLDSQRDIEMATAAYGQGVAFTPIATVRALSVLANGGTLITPHLVKKIDYENGLSKKMSFAPGKQVIKKETSEEITRMLVNVVDKALRGGTAKIPGVSVAAKTGTAQMTEEGRPGYVEGKYLHSFFGYFPAYKPRFLVFLFHLYPKNVRYASETLTDPFLSITKFLINYYQIPPDKPDDV